MSAWVRGNLLWKGKIFKKKSEIPQNDLTKPNIEGQGWSQIKIIKDVVGKSTNLWRIFSYGMDFS